jgi:hypothetical protein
MRRRISAEYSFDRRKLLKGSLAAGFALLGAPPYVSAQVQFKSDPILPPTASSSGHVSRRGRFLAVAASACCELRSVGKWPTTPP